MKFFFVKFTTLNLVSQLLFNSNPKIGSNFIGKVSACQSISRHIKKQSFSHSLDQSIK